MTENIDTNVSKSRIGKGHPFTDEDRREGNIVKPLHGALRKDLIIRRLRGDGWRLIMELIENADLTYAEQYNIALALDCKEYMLDPDKGFGAPPLMNRARVHCYHGLSLAKVALHLPSQSN